jgi:exopolysaccharide biosynthesis protein
MRKMRAVMITATRSFLVCLIALFIAGISAGSEEYRYSRKIDHDVEYTQILILTDRGPLRVHKLKINMNSTKIKVRPAIARDKIGMVERVDSIARRENAIAAINGTFFESKRRPHLPIGILVTEGKVINKSLLNRAAMGVTSSGNVIFGTPKIKGTVTNRATGDEFFVWGVNRPRKNHEVILYTPEYGKTTGTNKWGREMVVRDGRVLSIGTGNCDIPEDGCVISFHGWTRKYADLLPVGSDVTINFGLNGSWQWIDHVITGGPMLIKDGEVMVKQSVMEELFSGFILKPSARTAVGVDEYGKLLFFVFDRRPRVSVGTTFSGMAEIMKEEGAIYGMALDGGGSSTMVIDGETVNAPMYGYPIGVSNALIVEKEGYRYVAKRPSLKPFLRPKPSKVVVKLAVVTSAETVEAIPLAPYSVFELIAELVNPPTGEAARVTREAFAATFVSPEIESSALKLFTGSIEVANPTMNFEISSEVIDKWKILSSTTEAPSQFLNWSFDILPRTYVSTTEGTIEAYDPWSTMFQKTGKNVKDYWIEIYNDLAGNEGTIEGK